MAARSISCSQAALAVEAAPGAEMVQGHVAMRGEGRPCRFLRHSARPLLLELEWRQFGKHMSWIKPAFSLALTPRQIFLHGLRLLWRTLSGEPGCQLQNVSGPTCYGTPLFEDEMSRRLWALVRLQPKDLSPFARLERQAQSPHKGISLVTSAFRPARACMSFAGRASSMAKRVALSRVVRAVAITVRIGQAGGGSAARKRLVSVAVCARDVATWAV